MPVPSNPTDFARLGHRAGLYLIYPSLTAGWIDRIQSIDPTWNANTDIYYELGNVDPVGFSQDPTEFSLSFEENLVSAEADFLLAGKDPAVATSFNLNDIIQASGSASMYITMRTNAGTNPSSIYAMSNVTVAELNYRFQVRQPSTFMPRIQAQVGRWYTSGNFGTLPAAVTTWGTPDTTSPGAVKGRDARIFFGQPAAGFRGYRIQSFNIRAAFPVERIEELGNRTLVGYLANVPDVTMDYDILLADDQPHDQWATLTSGYYDFNNLTGGSTLYVNLYDPSAAEGTSALRGWRMENVVAVSATPMRAQVRGLSTVRYSLRVSRATTTTSGGLTVFRGAAS